MNTLTDIDKIKIFFPHHGKNMVNNFLLIIGCIIQCRTVCLYKCRDKVKQVRGGKQKSKANSDYTRLIRFFKMKMLTEFIKGIRQLLISLDSFDNKYLIMDRSNWKIGTKNVNLLTIGGLLENVFIPFTWIQLNKRGNSNTVERKRIIEMLIELFEWSGKSIEGLILLTDREFIGDVWWEYLCSRKISFVTRLRENMYGELTTTKGKKNFIKILK